MLWVCAVCVLCVCCVCSPNFACTTHPCPLYVTRNIGRQVHKTFRQGYAHLFFCCFPCLSLWGVAFVAVVLLLYALSLVGGFLAGAIAVAAKPDDPRAGLRNVYFVMYMYAKGVQELLFDSETTLPMPHSTDAVPEDPEDVYLRTRLDEFLLQPQPPVPTPTAPPQAAVTIATAPPLYAELNATPAQAGHGHGDVVVPVADRRVSSASVPRSNSGMVSETVNVNDVFDAFYASCCVHVKNAIAEGQLSRGDVEDLEPYLFIGVPAVAIFSALRVRGGVVCRARVDRAP